MDESSKGHHLAKINEPSSTNEELYVRRNYTNELQFNLLHYYEIVI